MKKNKYVRLCINEKSRKSELILITNLTLFILAINISQLFALNTDFLSTNVSFKSDNNSIESISAGIVSQNVQQKAISGTVTDEFGEPLPGATIIVKGTTIGTQADFDGKYSISNVPEDAILVFSFIGMTTVEIPVNGQAVVDVVLEMDAFGLEETIVIGYGSMKKSDLTGSVSRVETAQLEEIPNVSLTQALQGRVAGVNVGVITRAGDDAALNVRGQNTLSSSSGDNAPLIVLDGIIYRGAITDLNTADIKSIDVLKDISSTAIYGSQASNGVILITSKTGSSLSEKPVITYQGSYSTQMPTNELRPMRNAELQKFYPLQLWERGRRLAPDYLEVDPNYQIGGFTNNDIYEGFLEGRDTDWYGAFTGTGYINSQDISISGRSGGVGYFVSGGMTDVEGFIKNDNYTRYNYRINVDAKINDWLNVGIESFLTSSDYSGVDLIGEGYWGSILTLQPWVSSHDENGEIEPIALYGLSPYTALDAEDSDKRLNIFGNIHADVKLPVEGLSYRLTYSQNYRTGNHDRFNPWQSNYTGYAWRNNSVQYDRTFDNILSYSNTFNDVHSISATLLYGMEKRTSTYFMAGAQEFDNDLLGYNKLEAGNPERRIVDSDKGEEQSLYSMGRVVYNYDDRYLLTGTVRRDGFSGFGIDKKIGIFPSFALGWVVSNEDNFIKDNINWINYLKLRGSYGVTGRRGVGRYDTKAKVNSFPAYVFGDGSGPSTGQSIYTLANNELGWETTEGINIGVDFDLFNSKLYGNIDYYKNNTRDILYYIQLPNLTGFDGINTNIGKVANNGIEFTLNSKVINNSDFNWDVGINFSRNRNKIVSILGFDNDGNGVEDDLVANQLFIGEPTDVIYDYEIAGMWQLADRDNGNIPNGFFPGTYKISDLNNDGSFSANDDRKILGYRDPSYRFGITNTFKFKNFSLYAFINSVQGGKKYYYDVDRVIGGLEITNPPSGGWDFWMPENPDGYFRRPDFNVMSAYEPNRYAQRNFIRLQDVSLSYTLDKKILGGLDIENIKVFLSGKNLVTLTKWRGWDPESGYGYGYGVPTLKNITLGLNVKF
tara:strand:+ start:10140 stop:13316 length:3177 start_codon:yes stop_codon:yes gene_type:complete